LKLSFLGPVVAEFGTVNDPETGVVLGLCSILIHHILKVAISI
jgi:hypothetical protein